MALLTHIIIALTSVGYTTYLWTAPTAAKFKPAFVLVALTLVSGSYLIWTSGVSLVRACLSGIIYIGAVALVIAAAERKLAAITTDHQ